MGGAAHIVFYLLYLSKVYGPSGKLYVELHSLNFMVCDRLSFFSELEAYLRVRVTGGFKGEAVGAAAPAPIGLFFFSPKAAFSV